MNKQLLQKQLEIEEDNRPYPYDDATGKTLVPGDTLRGKLTIGIGHNLTDKPLAAPIIRALFDSDLFEVVNALNIKLPWWTTLDDCRQRVLADMCFNMGIGALLGFPKMLAACQRGDYLTAANEMRSSDWFKQVGERGTRLAAMMETGEG